jgi:hypothetical protein
MFWTLFHHIVQETEILSSKFNRSIMFIKSSIRSLFLVQSAWSQVSGQSSQDYISNSEVALATLQTWYNTTSGIWDTTGWWNSANCLTVLGELAAVDTKVETQASVVFANTLVQAQTYNLQMTKVITQDFDMSSLYGNYALGGDLSFLRIL